MEICQSVTKSQKLLLVKSCTAWQWFYQQQALCTNGYLFPPHWQIGVGSLTT
jgi:hypothetical protein